MRWTVPKKTFVKIVTPKKRSTQEIEEVELEDEDPTEEEVESSEKVADFQARFSGKQYKVRIERFNPTEAEWEWVVKLPLEGFEPFNVLPKYGGGKYKAVLIDDGGHYVKGGMMHFRFSVPIEMPTEKPRSALEDPVVVMMLESQKQQAESQKQQSAMLMEILKTSLPGAQAATQKGMDAAQVMEMFAKFSALTAPKENSMKSFMEMVGLWEKAKDAFTPDEKESGGIVSEIKEAIGALALLPQIRGQVGQAGAPMNPPARAPNRVISPTAPIVINPVVPKKEETMRKALSPAAEKALFYVPKIEEAARENADVEKWADKILDILDEEVIPALVKEYNGFVSAESIYDRLLAGAKNLDEREIVFIHAPPLLPYKEWLYRVIDEAVRVLETPDTEELGTNGSNDLDGGCNP